MESVPIIQIKGKKQAELNLESLQEEIFCAIEGQGAVEDASFCKDKWSITISYESPVSTVFILQESIKILEKHGLNRGDFSIVYGKKYS